MQHGAHGGVSSLIHAVADCAGAEIQPREEMVHQRGLPHPGRSGKRTAPVGNLIAHLIKPFARFHTGEVHGIAHINVFLKAGARGVHANQIHLVHDDPRSQIIGLRNHEEPIEHAGMRLGTRRREHHQHLIEIRDHDPLAIRPTGIPAGQLTAPRMDHFDCGGDVRRLWRNRDPIAHREFEPLTPFLFEPPPQRRRHRGAVVGQDLPDATRPLQYHPVAEHGVLCHVGDTLSDAGRVVRISPSSVALTVANGMAPNWCRTIASLFPVTMNPVSRWPVTSGSPALHCTKKR